MKVGTNRLETFSDGVIAIIITIMILEFKLPELNSHSTTAQMLGQLRHFLPYFTAYILSFTMIAILWTSHHHLFHFLEKTDEWMLWQNFVFLFLISLIPFATYLIGATPLLPLSPAIYSLILMLTTLSLAGMQHYGQRKKLLHSDRDPTLTRKIFSVSVKAKTKALASTLIYLLAIPLAFIQIYLCYLAFLLPPIIFFIPEGIDDEKLASKVSEMNG